MRTAVIVDAVRTPSGRGDNGGALSGVHPAMLLAETLWELCERNAVEPGVVDEVIAGCVSQSGEQSANIARTAVLAAGFPESVPGTTVSQRGGSSQQAAHFAAQAVISGACDVVIACGVESMSRVPVRPAAIDGDPVSWPLTDRYPDGLVEEGISAELIAARWDLSRSELDAYAARSHELAATAADCGVFTSQIAPVTLPDGAKYVTDETIRPAITTADLAALRPQFENGHLARRFPEIAWRVTAGNSAPPADGAAAVLIMDETRARQLCLRPRARFRGFAVGGSDPVLMLTSVLPATRLALWRAGLRIKDIDTFEVNETFAAVPLMWAREFEIGLDRVNPCGGALALGHPLGASGARLLTTLIANLEATGGRYALQTMCAGGGMADATVIERV